MSILDWFLRGQRGELPSPTNRILDGFAMGVVGPAVTRNWLRVELIEDPEVLGGVVLDTNSMEPFIDAGCQLVLIRGRNPIDQRRLVNSLNVGDIISYRAPQGLILHAISKIDTDDEGRYYRCKGYGNYFTDPQKVRDIDIAWIYAGVIN